MQTLKVYKVGVGHVDRGTTYGPGKKTYRDTQGGYVYFVTYDPREIYDEFPLTESITEIGIGYIGDVAFSKQETVSEQKQEEIVCFTCGGSIEKPAGPCLKINQKKKGVVQDKKQDQEVVRDDATFNLEDYACPTCQGLVMVRSEQGTGKQKETWFTCDRESETHTDQCFQELLMFQDGKPTESWLKINQEKKGERES